VELAIKMNGFQLLIKKFVLRWGPAILIMGLIFFFSSLPMKPQPPDASMLQRIADFLLKKGGHLLGYALLALALQRGLHLSGWKGVAATMGIVLLFALSDEFHQSFVPGRTANVIDVGIDLLGAALGLMNARVRGVVLNDMITRGKI
jgi:VanZ family protein